MSITYPTTLDSLTNPLSTDRLNSPSHSTQHADANDAIEALEAKVGVNSSAVTTSLDYLVKNTSSSNPGHKHTLANGATDVTASAAEVNLMDGVTATTTELNYVDTTVGTATASKAVILDSNKDYDFGTGDITATNGAFTTGSITTQTNSTLSTGVTLDGSANENMSLYGLARQALINGNFDIWQRNTTFTQNDDLYIADRWNALQEANSSWTFARDTDVPDTKSKYSLKCTNVTLNNQCAIVQILENVDTKKLTGRTVSLSFAAKTSGTEIANLRATVLAWTSTADSVTSDVIGTWASDGTDPTWATNWTSEVAGANKALTSSWQTFKVENISLDTSSTNNLAVVIWVDDGTIAANDDFWITQVQLNVGAVALPFQPYHLQEEFGHCLRYFQKTGTSANGRWNSASVTEIACKLAIPMRTAPTVTLNSTTPAFLEIGVAQRVGSSSAVSGVTYTTATGFARSVNGFSGATTGGFSSSYDDYFNCDAEL